jgi:hypothetical protein
MTEPEMREKAIATVKNAHQACTDFCGGGLLNTAIIWE